MIIKKFTAKTEKDAIEAAKKELESYKAKAAAGAVDELCKNALEVNGVKIVVANAGDADGDSLKTMGDKIKDKLGCGVVLLASNAGGRVNFVAMATDDAVKKGANAGKVVKAAAEAAALKKVCPFCQTEIHVAAKRCPHCTSELDA